MGCRLGYWSNTCKGKVWYDDIAVVRPLGLKLEEPRVLPGGRFGFSLVAPPYATYRVEKTTDFASWSEVQSFSTAHPITEIVLEVLPSSAFYRAKVIQSKLGAF